MVTGERKLLLAGALGLTAALADEWTPALTAGVTICDAAEPTPLSHIVTPEEPRERRHPGSIWKLSAGR